MLDFTVAHNKIWFPEWVENNIGVLDPTVPLPLAINASTSNVIIHRGQNETVNVTLSPSEQLTGTVEILTQQTADTQDLKVTPTDQIITLDKQKTIPVNLSADDFALAGTYKIVVAARYQDVTISQFITVTIQ